MEGSGRLSRYLPLRRIIVSSRAQRGTSALAGQYFVYVVSSQTRVIYVGITNDLKRRLWEHQTGSHDGFTRRYRVNRLVHVEITSDVRAAIAREK